MRCKIHQTIPFPKEGLTVGRGSTEAGPGAGGPHVPAEDVVPYLPLQPAHQGVSGKQEEERDMIVSFRPQLPLTLPPAPPLPHEGCSFSRCFSPDTFIPSEAAFRFSSKNSELCRSPLFTEVFINKVPFTQEILFCFVKSVLENVTEELPTSQIH